MARAAADFVYPPCCPFCGVAIPVGNGESVFEPTLCAECRDQLAPPIAHCCSRCAAPVGPHLDTSGGCIHCRKDRFQFESVTCLGVYDGPLRSACLRAQTSEGRPLAAALAWLLWRRESDALQRAGVDVVVSIPRHWTRRIAGGHNPSETLCEVLARRLKVGFGRHILAKVRRTPAQTSLPSSRRRSNLRRAFRVRGTPPLAGASVLLVDDVLTTGTTANEASRMLRRSGAARVIVAVLARGIGR